VRLFLNKACSLIILISMFHLLGNPLACLNEDEREAYYSKDTPPKGVPGGFIPLTRIKTLVSMTTPRDAHSQAHAILPPFVEFDMDPEGFGCLFLSSVAPNSGASSVVGSVGGGPSQEGSVIGGIGAGDRVFPPSTSGLTFSTWFCVEKFSDPRTDPHPVRLLTVVRRPKESTGPSESSKAKSSSTKPIEEDSFACLNVCLSARDKAVIITTQESEKLI